MKTKLLTLVTAILFAGNIMATELLSIDFTSGQGDWTISNVELSGLDYVWIQNNTYGMKASGYYNKTNHATESWLISPTIDLSNMETATMAFSHAVNYASPSGLLSVKASADGDEWSDLEVSNWPAGNNWTFVDAEASLNDFVGESAIQIAFVYTSYSNAAATWEIKTVSVEGEPSENPDVDPGEVNYDRVKIGDLYYNLYEENLTAEVTSQNSSYPYWSTLITTANIPASVTYNGKTYRVTSIGNSAFNSCDHLYSVDIPNSVTSIGNYAFQYSDLSSVTIPDGVTSIGNNAFSDIEYLAHVTIPNSVTSIGESAFNYCYYLLDSIEIPSSVTSIGKQAFGDCGALKTVTINSNAIVSKDYTNQSDNFCNIFGDQVESYIIGNSVTSIGKNTFNNCRSLTSVTIPNSVTSIGENAFVWCGLTSVTIPNSVTSIGKNTFNNCRSLTSVTIPNSVTSIGEDAFLGCGLTSVTIPNSVTSIEKGAFLYCSGLTRVNIFDLRAWYNISCENWSSNPLYYAHHLYLNDVEVKDLVIPDDVTSIRNYAFEGCSGLVSVTIPNSVTSIGDEAFYGCSGLTSVTIPNSVTNIGACAFSSLTSVTLNSNAIASETYNTKSNIGTIFGSYVQEFTFGEGVTSIGDFIFYNVRSLTSLTIGNSVTSIGYRAFYFCTNLKSVTIGNSVTSIGEDAFEGCYGMTSLTIGNSVTSIGDGAFYGCSGLVSVTIPNSVTSIGYRAFYGCSGLTSVTIPNSVASIGQRAFENCNALTKVNIFDLHAWCNISFEDEFSNPLYYAKHLYLNDIDVKDLIIPDDVTSIRDYAFYNFTRLTSVIIPSSVTSIGGRAFYGCSGLTSVTIGNGVTSIGYGAFNECNSLTSLTIPNSVASIGYEAFEHCSSLTSITCEAVTPPAMEERVFGDVDKSIPLYVPAESVSAYKVAEQWREFNNIVAIGGTTETYTITFLNYDGTVLQVLTEVEEGEIPVYTGETPTRPDDSQYTYTFIGWTPKITEATADATYTATYDEYELTALPNIEQMSQSTKIIEDGQLFILRDGKTYTVQGQEVR